jgi:hypothetical protein
MSQDNDLVALATAIGHADAQLATEFASGLRLLATLIEENPELADNFRNGLRDSGINVHLRSSDPAAEMANIARIARRYGATTNKSITEKMHNVMCDFGTVRFDILAWREEVCERVVVDTREVVEEVPDPELLAAVPTVTVTRTEDVVEWQCRPLLAAEAVQS